jgi:hypothetical protein
MKRMAWVVAVLMLATAAFAADPQAIYLGGTSKLAAGTAGNFDTTQTDNLVFEGAGGKLTIPYKLVEFSRQDSHLAHRMGVLPLVAIALVAPLHKRYYVRITYHDESNVAQFANFEVSRAGQDALVSVIEARRVKKPYSPSRICGCGGCVVQGSSPCEK